jgi:hypothetical protein
MTDDLARAGRVRREFEETQAAFDAVRLAMVETLFATAVDRAAEREKLYLGVQVLDAVRKSMMDAISTGEIEEYAQRVRNAKGSGT